MGNTAIKESVQAASESPALTNITTATGTEKPKCKACCACPETKKVRDQCIIEKGEEHCTDLIEAHKQCMRDQGFNI